MRDAIDRIQNQITDRSITLYWDMPKAEVANSFYRILLNHMEVGTTVKTHFEFAELEEDTPYEIRIQWEQEDKVLASSTVWVKTKKKKKIIDITKKPYCAVGDGETMNTRAIQQAIDDCTEESMVYIPTGIFKTGALRLHSDMELYLAEGAVIQGTDDPKDYLPKILSRFEGIERMCYSSLLNLGNLDHAGGYNCKNVVIRGKGTIASGGRILAERVIRLERERLKQYLISLGDKVKECENADTIPGRVRPRLINMSNCQNVTISGLDLKDGASWNVHMIYSDHIVTDHCRFYSKGVWNGDGWDPDSSTNCTIFACEFFTGDDGIAIKSGKNPEGNIVDRPCSHIRIFDCKSIGGHGFTIGSEMSGGIEDIAIWDCDLEKSLYGIEIKGTKKRGGYVRNVNVRNCIVPRILIHSVNYNDDGEKATTLPIFENCCFRQMHVTGKYMDHHGENGMCDAIELCGFDRNGNELRDIVFEDLKLGLPGQRRAHKISLQYCKNVTFSNIENME